jgi:two-component system cell cycle sensor histidine kinase/response regulator CckA
VNTSSPESDAGARILVLERLLQASERRCAATLAHVRDGVISTDAAGRVTFMNPVAESVTKWTLDEAKGLSIEQVFPLIVEATGAIRENSGLQALRGETVRLDEPTLLAARDGERIPIDYCAAPIFDESDGVLGSVTAFRDCRAQRHAEDTLKRAGEQLSRGSRMDALGRLAQGIAHDFNNILTIVIGLSDLLTQSNSLSAHERRILDDIHEAGQRGADLVRQLLRFGRARTVQSATIDLGGQIADVTGLLRRLVGDDIALTTVADPDLWSICADPSQTEQVLMNLTANARDAMPAGGRLVLATRNVHVNSDDTVDRPGLKPGRYVLLSVTDTGVGMDQTIREHMFEPFFTTKDVGRGTGLGLATVYGIVKQWSGFIFATSEVGKGTTFELFFPAMQATSTFPSVSNHGIV